MVLYIIQFAVAEILCYNVKVDKEARQKAKVN
jgi:hypothetical protein